MRPTTTLSPIDVEVDVARRQTVLMRRIFVVLALLTVVAVALTLFGGAA